MNPNPDLKRIQDVSSQAMIASKIRSVEMGEGRPFVDMVRDLRDLLFEARTASTAFDLKYRILRKSFEMNIITYENAKSMSSNEHVCNFTFLGMLQDLDRLKRSNTTLEILINVDKVLDPFLKMMRTDFDFRSIPMLRSGRLNDPVAYDPDFHNDMFGKHWETFRELLRLHLIDIWMRHRKSERKEERRLSDTLENLSF